MNFLKNSIIQYVLGIIFAGGAAFLYIQYIADNLIEPFIVFGVPILILILIGIVLIAKKKLPYLGFGIVMAPLALILFVALFLIEITIHPPDEE